MNTRTRFLACSAAIVGLLGLVPAYGVAAEAQGSGQAQSGQARGVARAGSAGQSPSGAPVAVAVIEQNADRTRKELEQLFQRYPPGLRRVLQYDPTLLGNDAYLAPYPGLTAFLTQHPEVAHNPGYFVGRPEVFYNSASQNPEQFRAYAVQNMMESAMAFAGLMALLGVLGWVLKMIIDHRRWLRVTKVQIEMHTKLLDRMASNEDLLAYVQTAAGRRFLDAAPQNPAAPAVAAPIGRILASVQIGTIAVLIGSGLLFLSSRTGNPSASATAFSDVAFLSPAYFMFGIIVLFAGIGFIASAAVSYALSRHLGLVGAPESSHA